MGCVPLHNAGSLAPGVPPSTLLLPAYLGERPSLGCLPCKPVIRPWQSKRENLTLLTLCLCLCLCLCVCPQVGRWFAFKERGASFTTECRAGFITFLMVSMCLLLVIIFFFFFLLLVISFLLFHSCYPGEVTGWGQVGLIASLMVNLWSFLSSSFLNL